jgi:hypothetical protein
MELTKSELEIAERCLAKREKQLAQWPIRRWLILAIFSVIALVGHLTVSDGMRGISDDQATDIQVSQALEKPPPPGLENQWAVGSMMKISKILELRHQMVTYSLLKVVLGYVQVLGGLIMVCLVILRWRPSARDALICKLLRAKLQELEQAPPVVDSSESRRTASSGGGG